MSDNMDDWDVMIMKNHVAIAMKKNFSQLHILSPVIRAVAENDIIEVWAKDSEKKGSARFTKQYVDLLKKKFPDRKWYLATPIQPSGMRLLVADFGNNNYIVLAPRIPANKRSI